MTEQSRITQADKEALSLTPDREWFKPELMMFRNPFYRCDRLVKAGVLESRVTGTLSTGFSYEYKRI